MTAPTAAAPAPTGRLPRTYLAWLAGALASLLGDAVLYFALGWAAAAHGGSVAGLVLTAITLPRTLLLLIGGAVADRFGVRRVMLLGDAAMIVLTVALAAATRQLGSPVWLLIAAGLAIGIVDAFYLPASGSMPRRLVGTGALPQALALRQTGGQLASLAGGAAGGFLVAAVGLGGVALLDAASFAVMLAVLLAIRPARPTPPPAPGKGSVLRDALEGLRVAWREPVLRPALAQVAAAAGFLLPVISLLVPLLGHHRGWDTGATGLVVGAQSLGIMAVAVLVVRKGGSDRPGRTAALGLLVAGTGTAALALSAAAPFATAAALMVGLGSGLFSTHVAPLVLTATPEPFLSRIQALLGVVQSAALLLMNNVLGSLAALTGPPVALGVCAAAVALTGGAGLASTALRTATRTATGAMTGATTGAVPQGAPAGTPPDARPAPADGRASESARPRPSRRSPKN
ncbi:MFS transporter [Actinomycetota bacterium Odt1-20B]